MSRAMILILTLAAAFSLGRYTAAEDLSEMEEIAAECHPTTCAECVTDAECEALCNPYRGPEDR